MYKKFQLKEKIEIEREFHGACLSRRLLLFPLDYLYFPLDYSPVNFQLIA